MKGIIVGYEVFKKMVRKEKKIRGKVYPECISYPCTSEFGVTAWSYSNLKKAKYKLNELRGA